MTDENSVSRRGVLAGTLAAAAGGAALLAQTGALGQAPTPRTRKRFKAWISRGDGPGRTTLQDVTLRPIAGRQVAVRTEATNLCCSNVPAVLGIQPPPNARPSALAAAPGNRRLNDMAVIQGHGGIGTVEAADRNFEAPCSAAAVRVTAIVSKPPADRAPNRPHHPASQRGFSAPTAPMDASRLTARSTVRGSRGNTNLSTRLNQNNDACGGARAPSEHLGASSPPCSRRCARIRSISSGASMLAMTCSRPPQGHRLAALLPTEWRPQALPLDGRT